MAHTMYQLIIAQLFHDGYTAAAEAVATSTGCVLPVASIKGRRLERLLANGMTVEAMHALEKRSFVATEIVEKYLSRAALRIPVQLHGVMQTSSVVGMRERFSSSSLGGVARTIQFSPDGMLLLVGGTEKVGSKIFALETMISRTNLSDLEEGNAILTRIEGGNEHLVLADAIHSSTATSLAEARHFTKHKLAVEAAVFLPNGRVLSGGEAGDVYLWSYDVPTAVDQGRLVHQDNFRIAALDSEPTGEYALVGTMDPQLRMLHIETSKLLTTPSPIHTDRVADVKFSHDGRLFASASFDGSFGVTDTVSGKNVVLVPRAHCGVPVTSCVFSRTDNIVLTHGMDAVPRLWDLRKSSSDINGIASVRTVATTSFGTPAKCEHRVKARFNSHESCVLAPDASLAAIHAYDVYSGDVLYSCTLDKHAQRSFAASPFSPLLATGSDDCKLRLWTQSLL